MSKTSGLGPRAEGQALASGSERLREIAQRLEDAAQDFHGPWGASQDPELVVLDAAKDIRAAIEPDHGHAWETFGRLPNPDAPDSTLTVHFCVHEACRALMVRYASPDGTDYVVYAPTPTTPSEVP